MYRKNVCCFIFNEHLHFLSCVRINSSYFQCVQGGIEPDDTDITLTALREIKEEIGLEPFDVTFVQEIPPPDNDPMRFTYELRPTAPLRAHGFRGQAQRVLLFYAPASVIDRVCLVPPSEQAAPAEFSRVAWLPAELLAEQCSPEKAHIIQAVCAIAPPLAAQYLKDHGIKAASNA